jgi:hypothetical protein
MVPLPRAHFSSLVLGVALVGCNVDRGDDGGVDDGLASGDDGDTTAPADDDDDDDGTGADPSAPGDSDDTGAPATSSGADEGSTGDAPGGGERLRYGLAVNPDSSPAALDAEFTHFEEIGVNLVWATAAMDWVCGGGSSCDFTPLDAVVERAEARGWPVVLQVHGSPQWLDERGPWFGPDTAERRAAWTDLFAQLVAHYGTRVAWYEVWNEPNIDPFWEQGPNPTDYALLLHDVYVAAKAIDPAVGIVGGNLSQCDLGFLAATYDALDDAYGAAEVVANHGFSDVLGVHPYAGDDASGYAPNDDSHADRQHQFGVTDPDYLGYRRMHDLVLEREGAAKDLVFGEIGYSMPGPAWFDTPEEVRAAYIVDALRLARDDGYVRYVAWYSHEGDDLFDIHGTPTEAGFTLAATEP